MVAMQNVCWWCGGRLDPQYIVYIRIKTETKEIDRGCWGDWKRAGMPDQSPSGNK